MPEPNVPEKRRSDRLMLTVPLKIKGTDSKGTAFEIDARTMTLNRHGARVQVSRKLQPGKIVRIINLIGRHEADFRVVGPLSPSTDRGGEWGVECVEAKANIWGIQFPPPGAGEEAESKALLECRNCHSVSLLALSLVEVEVLQTAGILTKECPTCRNQTPWGYAEKQVAMSGPAEEAAMVAEAERQVQAKAKGGEQRRHRRVALQLPILVRDYHGGSETKKSENISKGGFCYVTEKEYLIGEGILVVCPYSAAGQNIEVRAKIVRRVSMPNSHQKIYGVRYEKTSG